MRLWSDEIEGMRAEARAAVAAGSAFLTVDEAAVPGLTRDERVAAARASIDVNTYPVPDAETDLLDAGLIDSLALVTLIVAFEDTFGVQLPLDGFDIDRFRSVASIADFLASLGAEPVQD